MGDTLICGCQQLLNVNQFLGFPSTQPSITPTYCYLLPRDGTLSNFCLYQKIPNYSNSYPDGDAGAEYTLYLNGTTQYVATIPGSLPTNINPISLADNINAISCKAGDLLSCQVIPNDETVFQGGSQVIISCVFN
jgi:hypothetical protein